MEIKQVLFVTGYFLHAIKILVAHNPHGHASGIDWASARPHFFMGTSTRDVIEEIKGTNCSRAPITWVSLSVARGLSSPNCLRRGDSPNGLGTSFHLTGGANHEAYARLASG